MNNNKKEFDISDKSSPDNLSEDVKELPKTLPPSERGNRFICKTFGDPNRDKFQIFIRDNVVKEIKGLPGYSGFLLGKHHLKNKSPFIEVSKQIPIENQVLPKAWSKVEEEISLHPNLSPMGWYYYHNTSLRSKNDSFQNASHIHKMNFPEPWEVALILNYLNELTFFGWGEGRINPKIIEFNGYIIFSEVEEDVDIQLEPPVEINPSCREPIPLKLKNFRGLSRNKFNIIIETEILNEIYHYTRSHCIHESGGILLGKYWQNENILYISKQIPALHSNAGRIHLTFTHETWNEINTERSKYPELLVVGWYHSHPGFEIFLSHHDYFIHKEYFNNSWQVALVIDPIWKKFILFGWQGNQIVRYEFHKI